ncbi:MAG: hypothetical protein IPK67_06470 [Planctomycetes bacterium]|nr:hypothetical protein [Planctomycetota bacterium]
MASKLSFYRGMAALPQEGFRLERLQAVHRDAALVEAARVYRALGASAAVLDLVHPEVLVQGENLDRTTGMAALLSSVPIAIEDNLAWDQVASFRQDEAARRKYRDLHLWLDQASSATSQQHLQDIIGQKLDDYRWAIAKHGLITRISAVTSLLSLGAVVPEAGGLAASAANISPIVGTLLGAGLTVLGVGAWAARREIELEDVKRGENREVAYIYELQSLDLPQNAAAEEVQRPPSTQVDEKTAALFRLNEATMHLHLRPRPDSNGAQHASALGNE